MKKTILLLTIFCFIANVNAQKKEFKCQDVYKAIKLMDEGKYDESIAMLKECEKVDPKDYTYPYEIALAYTYKKEYQKAIDQLEKIKKYESIAADYYQLLGNNYDYAGKPEKAMSVYDDGLKKFPNAGRLYLEKGVILEFQEKYTEAIASYEKGVKVDPMYSSNYYRLALLYSKSTNKLAGLIYGEIFINLERTTKRTSDMSKLLYETYKGAITIDGDKTGIEFCEILMDMNDINKKDITLPFCAVFGKNFILSILDQKEVNLNSLSEMRIAFLKSYYTEDFKKYPNVLLKYQKTILDNDIFEAYSKYIFQVGAPNEFKEWKTNNKEKYDKFVEWYTNPENSLKIDDQNVFIYK
ncbi:MAG: tetratricopeptide repeat protein [Bacteroidota bacterium]